VAPVTAHSEAPDRDGGRGLRCCPRSLSIGRASQLLAYVSRLPVASQE
jgi:hypothetical protein